MVKSTKGRQGMHRVDIDVIDDEQSRIKNRIRSEQLRHAVVSILSDGSTNEPAGEDLCITQMV